MAGTAAEERMQANFMTAERTPNQVGIMGREKRERNAMGLEKIYHQSERRFGCPVYVDRHAEAIHRRSA